MPNRNNQKTLILTGTLLLSMASLTMPVKAEETVPLPKLPEIAVPTSVPTAVPTAVPEIKNTNIKRLGIDAGLGVNLFLPFAQAQLLYRLPALDDRLELFIGHSIGMTLGDSYTQAGLAGLKYYISNTGFIQPFISLGGGVGFQFAKSSFQAVQPLFTAGLGADFMFSDNFGAYVDVESGFPIVFRPGVGIKLLF